MLPLYFHKEDTHFLAQTLYTKPVFHKDYKIKGNL